MLEGIIVKGIAGFYYVELPDGRVIECKARGKFRKEKLTPIVGDRVEIDLTDAWHGVINEIKPRKNYLIRPQVSNVDQALVVFALKKPDINYTLLDKLLIAIEHSGLEAVICFNKSDLDEQNVYESALKIYSNIGYKVIKTNARSGEGINLLKEEIKGKVSVFAGPSGVGKSTIFNLIQDKVEMKTGDISKKVDRGKHTTRHAELIEVYNGTYIVDTPGFSSLELNFIKPEELQFAFREFGSYLGQCRFSSCRHFKEMDCRIKEMVQEGVIPVERYNAYVEILEEIQEDRRNYK